MEFKFVKEDVVQVWIQGKPVATIVPSDISGIKVISNQIAVISHGDDSPKTVTIEFKL